MSHYPLQNPHGHMAFKHPTMRVNGYVSGQPCCVPSSEVLISEESVVTERVTTDSSLFLQRKLLCCSGSLEGLYLQDKGTWVTEELAIDYPCEPPWVAYYLARKGGKGNWVVVRDESDHNV